MVCSDHSRKQDRCSRANVWSHIETQHPSLFRSVYRLLQIVKKRPYGAYSLSHQFITLSALPPRLPQRGSSPTNIYPFDFNNRVISFLVNGSRSFKSHRLPLFYRNSRSFKSHRLPLFYRNCTRVWTRRYVEIIVNI